MNQLNLIFGPSINLGVEAAALAYITSPLLTADKNVSVLSAERYVSENFYNLTDYPLVTSSPGSAIISYSFSGTTLNGEYTSNYGQFLLSGTIPNKENYTLPFLNSPITTRGLHVSAAGSWNPVIQPGVVFRNYTVSSLDFNAGTVSNGVVTNVTGQLSWIARSGLQVGDEITLIYTIPEHRYKSLIQESVYGSSVFPGAQAQTRLVSELCTITSPTTLQFSENLIAVVGIIVNGKKVYSGMFDGTKINDPYIVSINQTTNSVEIRGAINSTDLVTLEYIAYADYFYYTGFKDYLGNWWPYDANPESGHYIGDWLNNVISPSFSALGQQTTIYTIPTAWMQQNIITVNGQTSIYVQYESAYNWGETHFVRHIVGQSQEDIVTSTQGSTVNCWGFAILGQNYYDQLVGANSDIFSTIVPTMLPIAKILLAAPPSIQSVSLADARQRGGGIPPNFNFSAVTGGASGLDTLRMLWDLGGADGPLVDAGGVVEISINSGLLNTFTPDQIEQAVMQNLSPGIGYVINYVDSL